MDGSALLNPLERLFPFSPFNYFAGRSQNEIDNYATELVNALCAIDQANFSSA